VVAAAVTAGAAAAVVATAVAAGAATSVVAAPAAAGAAAPALLDESQALGMAAVEALATA